MIPSFSSVMSAPEISRPIRAISSGSISPALFPYASRLSRNSLRIWIDHEDVSSSQEESISSTDAIPHAVLRQERRAAAARS